MHCATGSSIHSNRAPPTTISTITEETQEELPTSPKDDSSDQTVNLKPVTSGKETGLASPEPKVDNRKRESSAELGM